MSRPSSQAQCRQAQLISTSLPPAFHPPLAVPPAPHNRGKNDSLTPNPLHLSSDIVRIVFCIQSTTSRLSSLSFISGAQQCAASYRSLGSQFSNMRTSLRQSGWYGDPSQTLFTYLSIQYLYR
ncbi:hypothetical protein CH063_06943 [Colletotrichum higginsianum]|uniref:Uncharacterized protein n=1 Tax=Colletotrichum higginsianum (strain IMI 349063) TaxID=759273 RepID=H1V4E1_COLHI|nr:hypothetical protein CH063_06943 [Colletotrichum higginsianum]